MNHIVITSINEPTEGVKKFSEIDGWKLIVVGDRKSPEIPSMTGNFRFWRFISVDERFGAYTHECRENSYARKNIGYLYAMREGAEIIAESDDDNIPYKGWGDVQMGVQGVTVYSGATLFNIYRLFKDGYWPRGYPLQDINADQAVEVAEGERNIGVWQFLADLNPDVDAISRMTKPEKPDYWGGIPRSALDKNTYCPFNSQNTFWSKDCFPLMYLPQTVTMRFCDILRGYVAQRILWEKDLFLGFGEATVYQVRNDHDLFKDFIDELPVYMYVGEVVEILESMTLSGSFPEMLFQVYKELSMHGIVESSELIALNAWNEDVKEVL